jgi:hypothetical protein
MGFRNFVCWKPDVLGRVLDTEALEVPDEIFLATHHPIKLYRQDLLQSNTLPVVYDEEDFLRDFLRPASFALVPVLGEAGTGKSHLIRWLAARLRDERGRRVVLIPRAGTNLRNVIAQILGDLPGKKLDEFRGRLQAETGQLTPARAAEILLDKLALEVGPNGLHESRDLDELQAVLVDLLPPLFRDPLFRKQFLHPGGIIERLCDHVVGLGSQVERLSERRQFALADLPLSVPNSTRASQDAQDCYSQLQNNPELRGAAIAWINLNLDAAIASLLQLRGETLSELMLEVREALYEERTELVILIEDFAKLQGIDRQLLDALLVKTNQTARKPLCAMRTAFGCTTGYFKGFAETLLQRLDFAVYMDASSTGFDLPAEVDLEGFVARYLNAVRLHRNELAEWYRAGEGGAPRAELPNACTMHECPHHTTCHAAFGSAADIGLYPFTRTSLRRMLARASPRGFNPRLLISKVLKHTLVTYGPDVAAGRFPSPALHAHFGDRLDPMVSRKVRDNDPEHPERRLALLDLWSEVGELVDLDPGIHAAFDLPPLKAPTTPRSDEQPLSQPLPPAPLPLTPQIPLVLEGHLRAIDEWSRNTRKLGYDLTNLLRSHLHEAVAHHVDWDAALLLKGKFCGGRAFDTTNINFQNQDATWPAKNFLLVIPADPKAIPDAALALKGLLLFRNFGNWKFKDGPKYFRVYASHLEDWGRQLLAFARSTRQDGQPWDPVPAALELLALDARASGRVQGREGSLVDYVDVLFANPSPNPSASRAKSWVELQNLLRDARPKLQSLVVSRSACTKGGSSAVKVVDAVQYVTPLQALRREWRFEYEVPADLRDEYKFLKTLRDRVDALLDAALEDERARHGKWLAAVLAEVGDDPTSDELTAAVKAASKRAQDEGVYAGKPADLEAATERMKTINLDQLIAAAMRIRDVSERAALIVEVSADRSEHMDDVSRFVTTTRALLNASRARLETDIGQIESKGGTEVNQSRLAIGVALAELSTLFTDFAGGGS